jgi:hypothetical protein
LRGRRAAPAAGQLSDQFPAGGGDHGGGPHAAVHPDHRTDRWSVPLRGDPGGPVVADGREPVPVRVPGHRHVQQPRMTAPDQPAQLRLRGAGCGDTHPPVLAHPHPTVLYVQAIADGEPGPVVMPGLEPGEPALTLQEHLVSLGDGADAVEKGPRRVLTRPRRHRRLGRGPQLRQIEVGQRPDAVGLRDAVAGLGVPLVGVRLDLGHRPVVPNRRAPAARHSTPAWASLTSNRTRTAPCPMTWMVPVTPDTTSITLSP